MYGNLFEIYYFHIWESEILKLLEGLCTDLFVWNFDILKLKNEIQKFLEDKNAEIFETAFSLWV